MAKLSNYLRFPNQLDMRPFQSTSADANGSGGSYALSAVVIHSGTATHGHYTCFARPDPSGSPEDWVLINDHLVSRASAQQVAQDAFGGTSRGFGGAFGGGESSKNAYLLFYSKTD